MNNSNDFEWFLEENHTDDSELSKNKDLYNKFKILVFEGNSNSMIEFLKSEAHGRNIKYINDCLSDILKSENYNYLNFWFLVKVLLSYNASLFMATICKNIRSNVCIPQCDDDTFNEIISYAFNAKEKLQFAIKIVSLASKKLSYYQKQFILSSCFESSNIAILKLAFDTLKIPHSIVINFLKDKLDNEIALYTLYQYYHDAYVKGQISNDTIIEVFSYPYINILIQNLKKIGGKPKDVAELLEYEFGISNICKNRKLYNFVLNEGLKGFRIYYSRLKQKITTAQNVKSIELNSKLYRFQYISKLDNYYILLDNNTNWYALLPFELASKTIDSNFIHAYVYCKDSKNKVLYVNQKPVSNKFENPPILNIGSIVEVSFCKRYDKIYPRIRNHTNLISIRVENIDRIINYKLKYKAIITKELDTFLYLVKLNL